jgi:hypothetical protein
MMITLVDVIIVARDGGRCNKDWTMIAGRGQWCTVTYRHFHLMMMMMMMVLLLLVVVGIYGRLHR